MKPFAASRNTLAHLERPVLAKDDYTLLFTT